MTNYPAAIDDTISLPVSSDLITPINAAVVNGLRTALIAIESALGVNPAAIYSTVSNRLSTLEATVAEIIISNGVSLAGDIGGTMMNPLVIGLQGHSIANVAPTSNQFLVWNSTTNKWTPTTSSSGVSLGGDLGGTITSPIVIGLQGRAISSTAPTNNQALVWNTIASQWIPTTITTNPGGSNTQVQFNDGGVFNGSPHFTFTKATGAVVIAPDSTGYLSIGSAPAASGDVRLYNTATVRAANGVGGDTTISTVDSSNILWFGSDNDALSHPATQVGIYPSGTINLGESGTTRFVINSSGATIYQNTDSLTFGHSGSASTGAIRMQNATGIYARNAANNNNLVVATTDNNNYLYLGVNTDLSSNAVATAFIMPQSEINLATIGGSAQVLIFGSVLRINSGSIQFGSSAASTGAIALQNAQGIFARNFGGTADIAMIGTDSSNNVNIGDGTNTANTVIDASTDIIFKIGSTQIAEISSSKFITSKGRNVSITAVTGTYLVQATDENLVITTNAAPFTITLPASPSTGDLYTVKDSVGNAGTNHITVSGNGNNIDGSASFIISTNYGSIILIFNGSTWSVY